MAPPDPADAYSVQVEELAGETERSRVKAARLRSDMERLERQKEDAAAASQQLDALAAESEAAARARQATLKCASLPAISRCPAHFFRAQKICVAVPAADAADVGPRGAAGAVQGPGGGRAAGGRAPVRL